MENEVASIDLVPVLDYLEEINLSVTYSTAFLGMILGFLIVATVMFFFKR